MTDDEIIAVVQAHKDGKTIRSEARGCGGGWTETFPEGKAISWNFHYYDYYIVPEPRKPREWMIVLDQNLGDGGYVCRPSQNRSAGEKVRVREVIE